MNLSSVLKRWLGPIGEMHADACALLVGAGLTKGVYGGAPLFGSYAELFKKRLKASGLICPDVWNSVKNSNESDIANLIEIFDHAEGRSAVVEALLSEPTGCSQEKQNELQGPFAADAWACVEAVPGRPRLPAHSDSTYRPLRRWMEGMKSGEAALCAAVQPDNGPVYVGRLLAEHAVDQIVTTNWDAYLELGAWLVGLELDGNTPDVLVIDRRKRAVLRGNVSRAQHIFKIHGGVDGIAEIYAGTPSSELNETIRESFLVSSSDLTHWRGTSEWAHDTVSNTLRRYRTLLVGMSGADPVVFRALRARIVEWNSQRDAGRAIPGAYSPDPIPVAAVDYSPGPRLTTMMMVDPRQSPVAKNPPVDALRAAYAWTLADRFVRALPSEFAGAARTLRDRVEQSVDSGGSFIRFLADVIGPALRAAALAAGRLPSPLEAQLQGRYRTVYAAWTPHSQGSPDHALDGSTRCAGFARQLARISEKANDKLDNFLGSGDQSHLLAVDLWSGIPEEAWLQALAYDLERSLPNMPPGPIVIHTWPRVTASHLNAAGAKYPILPFGAT